MAPRRAARPRGTKAAGFTLIEILVVLAIVAALLALAPTLTAGIPGLRLRAATAELADTLRQLHDQATRSGRVTSFTLDETSRRFGTSVGEGETSDADRPLPSIVDAATLTTASPLHPEPRTTLWFFPDGSATGARLQLRHGGSIHTVMIDWLTGRITHDAT